jgi:hypothetical protein
MKEECRSGESCGLCFTRRTRPLRKCGLGGRPAKDPWAPLTAVEWRSRLGAVTGIESAPCTERCQL